MSSSRLTSAWKASFSSAMTDPVSPGLPRDSSGKYGFAQGLQEDSAPLPGGRGAGSGRPGGSARQIAHDREAHVGDRPGFDRDRAPSFERRVVARVGPERLGPAVRQLLEAGVDILPADHPELLGHDDLLFRRLAMSSLTRPRGAARCRWSWAA